MIQLTVFPKPQVLVDNDEDWTKTLMEFINNGQNVPDADKNRYRHADIKTQVKSETNEKCVYCESKVSHQYPGDIEHIIPKAIYPRLTFTWKNLTFVCYWCNNHKRDYVGKNSSKLLNPYNDVISEHLYFFGPLLMHINNSVRGEITWKQIKLNRKELIDRRSDKLKELQNLIDKYEREVILALKQILLNEILDFANEDQEYSFACNCYLSAKGII